MKIVIDGRMLSWTGIGRYTERLLTYIQELDQTNDYVVLLLAKDYERWRPTSPRMQTVRVDIQPYSLGEQTRLPRIIAKLQPDLVHFPHFTVPFFYRKPYVVTIHDLILLDFKNIRGSGLQRLKYEAKYWVMRAIIHHAVRGARTIITDTEYVKEDLIRRYGVRPSQIHPILLAAEEQLSKPEPITRFDPGDDYLLYVGNYYPNKNIGRLLEALKILIRQHPELKLVLTGNADYFRGLLEEQTRQLGLTENVIFTGFVSDGELASLYGHALVYVFPSLSEGFGLPGLEAMAYGVPVAASNVTTLPEVYGDAAYYFDPRNPGDMAAQISKLLNDQGLREKYIEAGRRRLKQFSWSRMAKKTISLYADN